MFGGGRAHAVNNGAGKADDSMLETTIEAYLTSAWPKMLGVNVNVAPETVAWAGIMGRSRDRSPWVGGVLAINGVWVCGGYSGHGMPLVSGCGAHIAELTVRNLEDGDWSTLENRNNEAGKLPRGYEISEERIVKARAGYSWTGRKSITLAQARYCIIPSASPPSFASASPSPPRGSVQPSP